ncbi:MAG: hypothetical protein A3K22_00005 [Deltaproteobacteria bacterium RBG_16_42_7]|nr:MAG: hypothetical protein A3K22_00005 [Deltaproteobacteria bacterium RBG_16_42_7]
MNKTIMDLSTIVTVEEVKLKKWSDLFEIISDSKDKLYDYRLGRSEVIAPVILLINRALIKIEKIRDLSADKEELANIDDIEREIKTFRQAVFAYESEVREGYRGGASAMEMEKIALRASNGIVQLSRAAVEDISKRIENKNAVILNMAAATQRRLWLILLTGATVSVTVAIITARALSNPINELIVATRKLADGELSYRARVGSKDEIGQLGAFFNEMAGSLQKTTVSRDYVDNIIRSMIDTLIVIDSEAKIRTVNKATCDLLGYKEEEIIGKPVEMIFAEEEVLNEITESAILISKDFKIIKANDAFLKTYGLTRKEVFNQPCYKITHDRDSICEQPNDICPIRESLEGHEPCVELHTHLNKEGGEVSVNVIAAPIKNKLGKTSYYLHLAKEVKKEEEKGRLLQGDLERIKRLTDKLESYVMRLEGEKIFTEGAIEKLMSLGAVENLEIYYKTKAGGVIPVSFSGSVMRGKEGEMVGIVGIARDMREIKSLLQKEKKLAAEAEESAERERAKAMELGKAYKELRNTQTMLIQSEKLSALGQMGAGVAHELNSPLAGVLSLIRTYTKGKNPDSEEYQDFKDMEEACEHMAKIIRDLSTFTRKSTGEFTDINITEIIESTLSFSGRQIERQGIKIDKNYDNNLPLIKGDESQLRQVVLNIVTNARDAISGDGTLKITTRKSHTDKGQFIEMEFSDTGVGINKEDIGKIFNPFFTTKRPGKGVGLGLSVTHTIVENHNGEILVDSEPGKGSTFTIRLPVTNEKR